MRVIAFVAILCLIVAASGISVHKRFRQPPKGGKLEETAASKQNPNFYVKNANGGGFHMVLKAGNGETIVTSEIVKQKSSFRKTIEAILRSAFNPKLVVTKDSPFMFNLKGKNGEIVGTSETYSSKDALAKGVGAVTRASIGFLLKFVLVAEQNKEKGKPTVSHFEGKQGAEFYSHIKGGNNEIVLNTATPSPTRDGAFENLAEIIGHALSGPDAKWKEVEQKESNGKQGWRGILLNDADKEIGRTEVYAEKGGLKRFQTETLPNVINGLFKAYWRKVIVDEQINFEDQADPAAPSAAAPSAPSAAKPGAEEEF